MQKVWSVVVKVRRNIALMIPINVIYTYEINFQRRVLNKILYDVDNNDFPR
jgi:hypothetical protein